MLFNSYIYIIIFLPIAFAGYFLLNKYISYKAGIVWLVISSVFFYSFWEFNYLFFFAASVLFNYFIGKKLLPTGEVVSGKNQILRRYLLYFGVAVNIGVLGFFKYTNFFIDNLNFIFSKDITFFHIVLPLGISFVTFQKIAYLVDSYNGEVKNNGFLSYALFVSFFPQLIAGPIVHHKEMMPQFSDKKNSSINYSNIAKGLFLFFLGLLKKVIVADTFAKFATWGFDSAISLSFIESWMVSLSYTLQLYFDFSGYSDMAIGAGYLFNIKIVQNFNSPYKALNIQDFWRRWHMTLSRFLKDYIFIPLGGSKISNVITYRNLFIVFLIGGLWHGAAWTFVVWGAMHGVATVVHRMWLRTGIKMSKFLAWFLTFNFVNVTWVFFRAKSFDDALKVLGGMMNFGYFYTPGSLVLQWTSVAWIVVFLAVVFWAKNSNQLTEAFRPSVISLVAIIVCFFLSFWSLNNFSEFIYFNF
jgi:D-alanyl-lipoteichoic acid acyltransferase DltB (MBOAT superfamily)